MSRSYLFVPADDARKLDKAAKSAADALILDLEDAVASTRKPSARQTARAFIGDRRDRNLWVRINPLDGDDALPDLKSVMPAGPAGIVLPKPKGAKDVVQLAKLLDAFEQEVGLPQGQTLILPIVTESPAALFHLHEYAGATRRLAALTWGAEDLSAAIGATARRDDRGEWLAPYQLARALCLIAAAAASVAAIDTVFTDFRNLDGLARYASNARRDGFSGMLAIHPDQVGPINEAFVPSDREVDRARRIVELFAAHPDAGTLGLDGEMIDRPHWLQAKRVLDLARQNNKEPR